MIMIFCSSKVDQINKPNYHHQNNIFFCHSKRHVLLKFIEILSYGLVKIGKGLYDLNLLLCIDLMFNISYKCVCNVLHPLSFKVNKSLYLKLFSRFFHHIIPSLACHVFFS